MKSIFTIATHVSRLKNLLIFSKSSSISKNKTLLSLFTIIIILEVKFDFIPKYVRESIERIDDIDVLLRKSIEVSSIEELEELLKKS